MGVSQIDAVERILKTIVSSHGERIYFEENKKLFNEEIRKNYGKDEIARDILLTLVVNDVFIFLFQRDFSRAQKNIYNCLSEFNLNENEYNRLFEIFKISEGIKKIKQKHKKSKIRSYLILFCVILAIGLYFVIDYKSYYRTPNEVLVGANYTGKAFFISKTEEHDSKGLPLVNMSWYEIINYCNELSKKNNLACVYDVSDDGVVTADLSKPGYRLPTKKEWYWAALGAKKENPIDYAGADKNILDDAVWYIENSREIKHPVAQKNANRIGLYDMSGNVAEWCWDTTDTDYRVVCGGFYGTSKDYLKLDQSQIKHKPNSGEMYIGFRLVRSYVKKNVGVEK